MNPNCSETSKLVYSTPLFQFGLCPVGYRSCHQTVMHEQPAEWVNKEGIVLEVKVYALPLTAIQCQFYCPLSSCIFARPTLWQQCIWSLAMPFVKLKPPVVGRLVGCQFYCLLSRLCGNPPTYSTMHMAASDLCQCRPSFLFVKQITAAHSVTPSNWQWRQTKSQMFALLRKQCVCHIFYLCMVRFSLDHTWLFDNRCFSNSKVDLTKPAPFAIV